MTKPNIGFIGLGLMGSAMVNRMLDLGYPMNVIANISRANVDAAVARGATEYDKARALAAASDVVMLCVDNSASVEARVYGDDGILAGVKSGALVIDFGTSLPGSTKKIAADMAKQNVAYMDAPLGRTPANALEGKLNIMAAGSDVDFKRAEPIFSDLGENVFHVGPLGAGHTLKLINNFFGMTTATAMSEAFAMADLAGLKRQQLFDVMAAGPLKSGMMELVKANAVDGFPEKLAFTIENAHKDVGYYSQMTGELGVPSPMVSGVLNALESANKSGWGGRKVSEMVNYFEEQFRAKK